MRRTPPLQMEPAMNKRTTADDASELCATDYSSQGQIENMHLIDPLCGGARLPHLRIQLHPDLQRSRPELLTPAERPTRRQIVDVLEQLDALATIGGQANVCEFAIEVINGLMSIVDVERLP